MSDKILLFDLDGTLIDSTEAILEAFLQTASDYDITLEGREGEICSMIGMTLADMFLRIGIPSETIQECVAKYRSYYREVFLQKTFLLPNVKELLQTLPSTYQMAVVTSKSHYFSEKILENLGVLKFFYTIVGIDDVMEPKPSAEPILKALHNLEYDSSRVFMIGDTRFDMEAAKNASVVGIGVNGKYQKDLAKYTSLVFADMEQALRYIEALP
ncbi:HAD family hydrolase [Helicobacter pametensis]|uniref:HAD family hydrolase n=1 Tax=Helicobacter pametensis TaxID=95149 RepID=UPI000485136E|nr:HAD family hydrolase [Helicobacter pametensis]